MWTWWISCVWASLYDLWQVHRVLLRSWHLDKSTLSLPFSPRHPTSCCSVAEIMSVLFFHTMKYRPEDPRNFHSDRFLMSKVWALLSYGRNVYFQLRLSTDFLIFSMLGSICTSLVLHVGWDRLPEGERVAQHVPGWLFTGRPPHPCKETSDALEISQPADYIVDIQSDIQIPFFCDIKKCDQKSYECY